MEPWSPCAKGQERGPASGGAGLGLLPPDWPILLPVTRWSSRWAGPGAGPDRGRQEGGHLPSQKGPTAGVQLGRAQPGEGRGDQPWTPRSVWVWGRATGRWSPRGAAKDPGVGAGAFLPSGHIGPTEGPWGRRGQHMGSWARGAAASQGGQGLGLERQDLPGRTSPSSPALAMSCTLRGRRPALRAQEPSVRPGLQEPHLSQEGFCLGFPDPPCRRVPECSESSNPDGIWKNRGKGDSFVPKYPWIVSELFSKDWAAL